MAAGRSKKEGRSKEKAWEGIPDEAMERECAEKEALFLSEFNGRFGHLGD